MKKKIPFILGLTGGIATGKTTVAKMFASFGAKVIDADRISHRLMDEDKKLKERIISVFSEDVLGKNGRIKRGRLAALIFDNPSALRRLNKIMHPAIISRIKKELKECKQKVAVLDAPLLIEAGLSELVDKLIVVKADEKIQVSRCRQKTGASKQEIKKRIRAQMPLSEKIAVADYVIDNNGRLDRTRKQVKEIWKGVNLSRQ